MNPMVFTFIILVMCPPLLLGTLGSPLLIMWVVCLTVLLSILRREIALLECAPNGPWLLFRTELNVTRWQLLLTLWWCRAEKTRSKRRVRGVFIMH